MPKSPGKRQRDAIRPATHPYFASIWIDNGCAIVRGDDEDDLDQKVVEEIAQARERGQRPTKVEMMIEGVAWTYEYTKDGAIEQILCATESPSEMAIRIVTSTTGYQHAVAPTEDKAGDQESQGPHGVC